MFLRAFVADGSAICDVTERLFVSSKTLYEDLQMDWKDLPSACAKDPLGAAIELSTQSVNWQVSHPLIGPIAGGSFKWLDRFPEVCGRGFMDCGTGDVVAPSMLFVRGLDAAMQEMSSCKRFDRRNIKRIAGAGQQHGQVYLREQFQQVMAGLNPDQPLADQLRTVFALPWGPIWMNNSPDCEAYAALLEGGAQAIAELTGSVPTARFFGPAIYQVATMQRGYYDRTRWITLISGFGASLLLGRVAELEQGDGAGGNLMNIRRRAWAYEILSALGNVAPSLSARLPRIVDSNTVLGPLSSYWVSRYGFSPECMVLPWSGDNPDSLLGVGIHSYAQQTRVLSKGSSMTEFCLLPSDVFCDPTGAGSVFGAVTGDGQNMAINTYRNSTLQVQALKDRFHLSWDQVDELVTSTPPGNNGRGMIGLYSEEISPRTNRPHVRLYGGLEETNPAAMLRALVEFQALHRLKYGAWMGPAPKVYLATGGGSKSRALLQVDADVTGATIYQVVEGRSSAVNGGCLRAVHSLDPERHPWDQLVDVHCPREGQPILPQNPAAYGDLKAGFEREMAEALAK